MLTMFSDSALKKFSFQEIYLKKYDIDPFKRA